MKRQEYWLIDKKTQRISCFRIPKKQAKALAKNRNAYLVKPIKIKD